ncbi:MAG: ATP-binding protein [Nanoarchaeota archaeon]|nr:ATP-binding protein [Nanoarchaeota archaeon]
MITKFIGRKQELKFLEERHRSKQFEFIPIYGRRRVGKTELILQMIRNKKAIYFLATSGTKKNNIERFKKSASGAIELAALKDEWDPIFEHIAKSVKERLVIAIDEFPYLIKSERGLSSIFQAIVDTHLKDSNIMLILCGSSMSVMLKKVLAYKAPLYGRRTGQIKLLPLRFKEVVEFLNKPVDECIRVYSICGGIPAYLNEFVGKGDIFSIIAEKVLKKDAFLREEMDFLLRQEFRDPKVYYSILSAVSSGLRNMGKIISYCGFDSRAGITPYLRSLEAIGYLRREVPVTERSRSKKGLYFIADPFANFWFRFVKENETLIEQDAEEAIKKIKPSFDALVASVFEDVCRELLWELRLFDYEKTGRWWHKGEEIDIVALNSSEKRILFAECKWQENVDASKVLAELKDKAKKVEWGGARKEYYCIFAKSFKRKPKLDGIWLIDMKDIEKMARGKAMELFGKKNNKA